MTATEAILNYAMTHGGTINRKDLLLDIARQQTGIKQSAITLQINRLIASGILRRIGHGQYELVSDGVPEYIYQPTEGEKDVFLRLKQRFPSLDMCVWNPNTLATFALSAPDVDCFFVDVEKDGMHSVFHALLSMNLGRNVLLAPSLADCKRYLVGTNTVVVRQLIGQSPLTVVDGCIVPRIEKILVDAIGDNELYFAGGEGVYRIFESARDRSRINMSKLLRYASRRNRKERVEQILRTINGDRPQEAADASQQRLRAYVEALDLGFLREYCVERGGERTFQRGETLEVEGRQAHWIGFVEQGCFKYVAHNNGDAQDSVVGFAFTNEFVGVFPNCVDRLPASVTVVADVTSKVFLIDGKELKELVENDARIGERAGGIYRQLFFRVCSQYLDFYRLSAKERYQQLLGRCPEIVSQIGLKDMASFLKVSPVTVGKIKRELS